MYTQCKFIINWLISFFVFKELMKHYCDNNMEKLSDGEMVEEDDGTVEVAEVVERLVM